MVNRDEHSTRAVVPTLEAGGARPCVGCGYNLVGLWSDAACPECGKPIWVTLASPPRWVDRAADARLVATGAWMMLGALFLSQLVTWLLVLHAPIPGLEWGVLVALTLWTCGVWVISGRMPGPDLSKGVRVMARMSVGLMALSVFAGLMIRGWAGTGTLIGCAGCTGVVALVGVTTVPLAYLASLALAAGWSRTERCLRLAWPTAVIGAIMTGLGGALVWRLGPMVFLELWSLAAGVGLAGLASGIARERSRRGA